MAWKYDNHPVGFYVVGDLNGDLSIIYLTGSKKGIKYIRFLGHGQVWNWSSLQWNCVDVDDNDLKFHGHFQTKNDVLAAFPNHAIIQEMMSKWGE